MAQQGTSSINGFVAAEPVAFGQAQGLQACSFRLGCTRRYYSSATQTWNEHPTTWITVKAFRSLASNVRLSVRKGDPVIVTGVLNTETWQHDGTNRSRIVIEATSIGHDLALGVSNFQRTKAPARGGTDEQDPVTGTRTSSGSVDERSGPQVTADGSNGFEQDGTADEPVGIEGFNVTPREAEDGIRSTSEYAAADF